MTTLATLAQQMPGMPWHNGGGMHWLWWAFWIVLLLALLSAFWRFSADRRETGRSVAEEDRAEEALRRRFAEGGIDEEEFARRLTVVRETFLGR